MESTHIKLSFAFQISTERKKMQAINTRHIRSFKYSTSHSLKNKQVKFILILYLLSNISKVLFRIINVQINNEIVCIHFFVVCFLNLLYIFYL